MPLTDVIRRAVSDAARLRDSPSAANEANTKAILIDPVLEALGWSPRDFEQVDREYRVFDGTLLDYALKVDGEKRLFVEAKALTEALDSPQFIAQTINYANNEGVPWCVLTNGLIWRVYKTNELVDMPRKLLFEESLSDGDPDEAARSLRRISRDSVERGELDHLGEQAFTDTRVRAALADLSESPPAALLAALTRALGRPPIREEQLQASLERLWGSFREREPSTSRRAARQRKPRPAGGEPPPPSARQDYQLDHHTGGKPTEIVSLFQTLDEYARSLGADVSRRIRKMYVGYYKGKRSFCTVELQRARIIIYLGLRPDEGASWWDAETMRDVSNIGHYGMGNTEFSFTGMAQLPAVKEVIRLAYEAAA